MKKELALHFISSVILLTLIYLFRYFNLPVNISLNISSFWPLFLGGLVGTFLPDLDHIIYVYYLRPYELTSQRVMYEAQKGNLKQSWHLLASTRSERTNLIFHSVMFQLLFLILSFLVVSSSGSLLGRGIVLAFLTHLFVDQVIDLKSNGNLSNWFKQIPLELDRMQLNIYLVFNFALILTFGFLL